jgi:transcriptional regulator with XRE-family HTH domain
MSTDSAVVERVVQQTIPAEGQVTVSLLDVDDKRFPNYRKRADETHLNQLFKEIKEHGQLTPLGGTWNADGKTIGIWSGFCRLEVRRRIALEKVVKEYNEFNKKQAGDEGYIALGGLGFDSHKEREKIREAGGEWKEKYENALRAQQVEFKTTPVENDADAALKGISANTMDKPPLLDLCERIESLCQAEGITAKKVAKALGMSEPQLSHHRKISATPGYLRELFKGDLASLGFAKKEDAEMERQVLVTAVDEFEKRLGSRKEDPTAISFSHAREFANAVQNAKEPMPLAGVAKVLKFLTRMSDSGKPTGDATPDWDVFRAKLSDAKRIGKTDEVKDAAVPAAAAAPAAGAAPAATTPVAVGVNTLSKEQQAEFDKAAAAASTPAPVSTGNTAATAPVTTTPTVGATPALSAEDQAKVAEIEAANAGGDITEESLDDLMGPSTEDLLAEDGTAAPIVPGSEKDESGKMRTKSTDAVVSDKYKMKAPERIEGLASRMLDNCADPRATMVDIAGYIQSAIWLYECVGMTAAIEACNELYVKYSEGANRYVASLEAAVKEARGEAVLVDLQQQKPKFERPKLS